MIRKHEFNSRWWGSEVGIVDDAAFFDLSPSLQEDYCAAFSWIEYSAPLDSAPTPDRLGHARFHWVDAQIPFRIGLSKIASTPSHSKSRAVNSRISRTNDSGICPVFPPSGSTSGTHSGPTYSSPNIRHGACRYTMGRTCRAGFFVRRLPESRSN